MTKAPHLNIGTQINKISESRFLKIDFVDREKIEEAIKFQVIEIREKMDSIWYHIGEIHDVVKKIVDKGEGKDVYQVAAEMLVQQNLLNEIALNYDLDYVSDFNLDSKDGVMVLTRNHSIIIVHPQSAGFRKVEYFRIPSRQESWQDKRVTYLVDDNQSQLSIGSRTYIKGALDATSATLMFKIPSTFSDRVDELTDVTMTTLSQTTQF